MIIDLDLTGRAVLVLGAGRQAERRIGQLLGAGDAGVIEEDDEGCGSITVLSEHVRSEKIMAWSKEGRVRLHDGRRVEGPSFVKDHNPDVVIAATDDPRVNGMAVLAARQAGILAYRSDSAGSSDYSHPALIRLGGGVRAAIFTGGRSPAVAKYVRQKAEPVLRKTVTPDVVARLQIQDYIRQAARSVIPDQDGRKRLLDDVMSDEIIDRLIRDGRINDAQERAMEMLGDKS